MPLELLCNLAREHLPLQITSSDEVDKLRVLLAAELVIATVPPPGSESEGAQLAAITAEGRAAIQRYVAKLKAAHLPEPP